MGMFSSSASSRESIKINLYKKYKKLLKTHDLVLLARKINAPQEIIILCSKINPSYTDTRYPYLSRVYIEEDAKEILNLTEKVLEWIEKNL